MALSFLLPPTPRTTTASSNPLVTESGRTQVHFLPPSSPYSMEVHVPAGPTIHDPPYHWHLHQTEHFRVKRGSTRYLLDGDSKTVAAPTTFSIPPGAFHTFYNGSTTEGEELVIEIGLDPSQRARDEAFFRNLYSYLDDCDRLKRGPNVCQLMLFLWAFECMVAMPGPKVLVRPLSRAVVWVLGLVLGKWLFGFRESYEEYYKPAAE